MRLLSCLLLVFACCADVSAQCHAVVAAPVVQQIVVPQAVYAAPIVQLQQVVQPAPVIQQQVYPQQVVQQVAAVPVLSHAVLAARVVQVHQPAAIIVRQQRVVARQIVVRQSVPVVQIRSGRLFR